MCRKTNKKSIDAQTNNVKTKAVKEGDVIIQNGQEYKVVKINTNTTV